MTRIRCCAVGLRIDLGRMSATSTFLEAMRSLLDRDVHPHPSAPTLVAFPEHTGLVTMFLGPRGEAARERLAAGAGTLEAMIALATSYGEVLGHYASRFPDVRSAGTLLHLACTDVMVRTIVDGFATLAAERRLWLTVGAALPDWERLAADDLDVEVAATLLGPASDHTDLYVPTGPQVRNRNLVFTPDGDLVAVHDKAYLVPMEADAEQGLGLRAAGLDEVTVADLPFGRVGTVISKDAWMPDVNERLGQLGAQVVIQPEAFDRWGLVDRDAERGIADLWPPDKFQRGGWWMVQRHPSFEVNVTPMLLGHLADLRFDGQALLAVPSPAGDPGLGLLGQPHDAGWATVGPWAGLDESARALADQDRRAGFERHAKDVAAAPAGSSAAAPTISEGAVWADIDLPEAAQPAAPLFRPDGLPRSVEVESPGTHLVPDLAGDGSRVWLAWVEVDGPDTQAVVVTRGDGMNWDRPNCIAAGSGHRWRPRLAVRDDRATCLFLGFPDGNWDLFAARDDGGWQAPVRVDDAHDDLGVLRERLHDAPVLTWVGDRLLAVWSDLRWPWVLPQVRYAWSHDGGTTWGPSARIDGRTTEGQPDPLLPRSADESRGQTTPAVAVTEDEAIVVYLERDEAGAPSVELHRLADGISEPPSCLARAAAGERLARPVLAATGATVWLVWERWDRQGGAGVMVRASDDGGRSWSDPRSVDPVRPGGATQRYATLVPDGAGATYLVFEDDRSGTGTVAVSRMTRAGEVGALVRVDDTTVGEHARAPTATLSDGHLVVAWQDTRDTTERIRTLRVALADLR